MKTECPATTMSSVRLAHTGGSSTPGKRSLGPAEQSCTGIISTSGAPMPRRSVSTSVLNSEKTTTAHRIEAGRRWLRGMQAHHMRPLAPNRSPTHFSVYGVGAAAARRTATALRGGRGPR